MLAAQSSFAEAWESLFSQSKMCAAPRWSEFGRQQLRGMLATAIPRQLTALPHVRAMSHAVHLREIEFVAVRAQGPGGQNVNKVSNAIHLRFDIHASSLPERTKARLLTLQDQRISKDGVIVIKAQASRSRDQNKAEALARLEALVAQASYTAPVRHATQPTRASCRRRLASKTRRGEVKALRGKVRD